MNVTIGHLGLKNRICHFINLQKDDRLCPKRKIALSAVPRYWELELMLLPSIKYDFTILR